jgi:Mg2+-importing ATPase
MVISYLALIELGKRWFYRAPAAPAPRHRAPGHRVHRRAARFTARALLPAQGHTPVRRMPARQDSHAPAA